MLPVNTLSTAPTKTIPCMQEMSLSGIIMCVMAFNSAYSAAPECGHSVRNRHPAGRDVGPSPRGRTERRHPGLQGRSHTFFI